MFLEDIFIFIHYSYFLTRVVVLYKMVAEQLDVQIEETRILT